MDDFLTQLKILTDMLDKKKSFLIQIMSITENQENILLSPHAGTDEGAVFFNGLNAEKHKLIEHVLESDTIFQSAFDAMKGEFELKAADYKDDVQGLKDRIKDIVETDARIRIREEKNRMLLEKTRPKGKPPINETNKAYVLKQYAKNKTQ